MLIYLIENQNKFSIKDFGIFETIVFIVHIIFPPLNSINYARSKLVLPRVQVDRPNYSR